MHVVVLGLWHLGAVTAACLARHHRVTGLDFDASVVAGLRAGRSPVFEPNLEARLGEALAGGSLMFSTDVADADRAEVVWICYDTPVRDDDTGDVASVMENIDRVLPSLRPGTVVLVSSQLPVGTCALLAGRYPKLEVAYSPENLRLGKAIEAFERPARMVVGTSSERAREVLSALLIPLGAPLVWMRLESAEMVKHALNAFLALSVAYINEIGTLSERVGADAHEVASALRSDPRIGPHAYLRPGGPFAGGTLAREVVTLTQLGRAHDLPLDLIAAIKSSNDGHRGWVFRTVQQALRDVPCPTVAILGLAYTTHTDTLRRSAAVELARQLLAAGVAVRAYDPAVRALGPDVGELLLSPSAAEAARGADAVVICTPWPEFHDYPWPALLATMTRPVVVDADRQIENAVASVAGVIYLTVGKP